MREIKEKERRRETHLGLEPPYRFDVAILWRIFAQASIAMHARAPRHTLLMICSSRWLSLDAYHSRSTLATSSEEEGEAMREKDAE